MLIWSKIFVFELRPTKFGGLVALPKGFPKMPRKVDQNPPVFIIIIIIIYLPAKHDTSKT